jgi:hypothetical protein
MSKCPIAESKWRQAFREMRFVEEFFLVPSFQALFVLQQDVTFRPVPYIPAH